MIRLIDNFKYVDTPSPLKGEDHISCKSARNESCDRNVTRYRRNERGKGIASIMTKTIKDINGGSEYGWFAGVTSLANASLNFNRAH